MGVGMASAATSPVPQAGVSAGVPGHRLAVTPPLWDSQRQGDFVVALARDAAGRLWVGTEGNGVWRHDPSAAAGRQWTQFTSQDGLGDDNAYALACDKRGRVWVGHLNHGVSVWNGRQWKNYGVAEGSLGERVFDIAVCPTNGDVWLATSGGLCRYSSATDRWLDPAQGAHLPAGRARCLAFNAAGDIFVGTEAHGLWLSTAFGDYGTWRSVTGPLNPPAQAAGDGLPSALINDVLVARDGTVYVATTAGLAYSVDGGRQWRFTRGADWLEKVRGRQGPLPPVPSVARSGNSAPPALAPAAGRLLLEDYVTCLQEDESGLLWLGYRQQGFEAVDWRGNRRLLQGSDDYVTALLPLPGGTMLLGQYGQGARLSRPVPFGPVPSEAVPLQAVPLQAPGAASGTAAARAASGAALGASQPLASSSASPEAPLPAPAPAPTLDQLNALLREAALSMSRDQDRSEPRVTALEDDWATQGDWLGRYGRYWACLCALLSPHDYLWGAGLEPVDYHAALGPHAAPDDALRYWVRSLYTQDARSLEMPTLYHQNRMALKLATPEMARRQAEWDDHGEEYPMSLDGPHLYCRLQVPPGRFVLSLYEVNTQGHTWRNRYRDYRLSIRIPTRPLQATAQGTVQEGASRDRVAKGGKAPAAASGAGGAGAQDPLQEALQGTETARGRVSDFWGGVYKRFVVQGPLTLSIEVNRNYSHNTLLSGVLLDQLDEEPAPYFPARSLSSFHAGPPSSDQADTNQAALGADLAQRRRWEDPNRIERQGLALRRQLFQPPRAANPGAAPGATSPGASPGQFVQSESAGEAVERLWQALEYWKLRSPGAWARQGRRFYGPLLRWYLQEARRTSAWAPGAPASARASQGTASRSTASQSTVQSTAPQPASPPTASEQKLWARLGTCYYQMGLYAQWEECQQKRGLRTARQIEKALRWDGKSSSVGRGAQAIAEYWQLLTPTSAGALSPKAVAGVTR